MVPCLVFEDEHLLVVNKPAGLNTHAPGPFAGEGLYDWLRHREPRWGRLAIIQRLDKETSGLIVFAKTALANRSLTEQFAQRRVRKTYLLLTDRPGPAKELVVKSTLVRAGERYLSRPLHAGGEEAETRFRRIESRAGVSPDPCGMVSPIPGRPDACPTLIEARPFTGRTHQIRVHAAQAGFPILGDTLYGGTPAPRVCLHASEITLAHPASAKAMTWTAPADFEGDARQCLRQALLDPALTDAWRLVHGASDGWPGWYVDRLQDCLLSQSARELSAGQAEALGQMARASSACGAYHQILTRQLRRTGAAEASPQLVLGEAAAERFVVRENGMQFALSMAEGYSVGLFLDQRDNRRRLLTGHIAADFSLVQTEDGGQAGSFRLLNLFAYTCAFSVCAARGGARTTSVDLSRKYLEWGKTNFRLNQLDPDAHGFVYGDAFDWLRRLAKRELQFEVILLDPPTFSQSKVSGAFRAEKDYGKLVAAALPLLTPGGVLFASTNAAEWTPEAFVETVMAAIARVGRKVVQKHYAPQPPDFPISRAEPGYLKTLWLRVG